MSDASLGTPANVPRENTSKRQRQGQRQGQYNTPLPPEPGEAPTGAKQPEYTFAGRTIRLNQADHDRWRASYHGIQDLDAELQAIDDWLQGDNVPESKRKSWFSGVSGMLRRKHDEAVAEKRASQTAEIAFAARFPPVQRSDDELRLLLGDDEFERTRAGRSLKPQPTPTENRETHHHGA